MKEICKNCGIWEGYHRHRDNACPLGGEDSGEFYENKFYRQRLRQKKQPNEGLTKREKKMKIFKYSFGAFGNNFKNDWFQVTLPKNFKPLSFQLQLAPFHPDDGSLEMWALIDEDEEEKEFDFICVGTGIEFDSKEAVYIGTAQDRPYVWHLFYKKETP